jgi:hypothetical protein
MGMKRCTCGDYVIPAKEYDNNGLVITSTEVPVYVSCAFK